MKESIQYEPDKWVILKVNNKDEIVYKVLAGWSGSYLYGSSWKLNSGITKIDKKDNFYLFEGYTGSVYKCRFNSYGFNGITASTLDSFQKQIENIDNVTIEVLEYKEIDDLVI